MTSAAEGGWRVADGTIRVYRLFDVADAIDLGRAEALAGAPTSRVKLEGSHTHSAIEIPRPPLHLRLGPRALPLASGKQVCEARANLLDYGVASVLYELPIPSGTPLESLLPLAEELLDKPTPALDAAARREAADLAAALGPALEKPHAWDGLETYTVFFVRAFEGGATARDLLERAPLARLLLGETSPQFLAQQESEDVLKHHFSYLEDDLAVVDWNSAFVYEPSGVTDIPDLLEFATAHLLELRYYDALLDRELHRLYDEIEAIGGSVNVLTRRYVKLQRRTAALLLELSEMTERLENAVKIVGDFYLARLYQAAVRRFRLPAWQETVLRKQRLLAGVNQNLNEEAGRRRAELLEITIILLILWEVVWAILR
ncbi:MAG TPA: hypothetical protein VFR85_16445 [Anaeromyxobacteraceae bacterium]|nr:hypothetical protein [Anaeromyxobacteraceae bacterium]